jgi:hypothetical protein
MRPVKACLQCRIGKRRCDRGATEACIQCIQRNLQCSAAKLTHDALSPGPSSPSPALLAHSGAEVLHLVDLYFKFIHDKAHTLFHEPTFKLSVAHGTASRQVVLSMVGLSAR